MARSQVAARKQKRHKREERLGFRLDEATKTLIERAAALEQRKLTDFCLAALADSARRTIERHDNVMLSDRDRRVFFDVLINPPAVRARLRKAFAAERRRVAR